MSRYKFILNDETKINQYGFRVSNAGLDLSRFQANPVLLDEHYASTWGIIGRWEDIQIEGHLLTAYAVFDMENEWAASVAGKVERGFLRGCSLGLDPYSMTNFVIAPDGTYDLIKSEVLEASVVAIPNNANAIKLYANSQESMKALLDSEVKEVLLMASDATKFNLNNQMKKVTLTLAAATALNLPTLEHDENVISEKIVTLAADLKAANEKIKALEELDKEKKAKLSADTVEADIKAGKIDATKKVDFIKLHSEQPDLYQSLVGNIPGKNNLGAYVSNPAGPATVKTFDEFEKLDLSAQVAFKQNYPTEYQALFK